MTIHFATDDRVNQFDAVQVRRAQIVARLDEYDDPSLMGRLACIDGKDGDRSNPFDRFDDLDNWDEFRRGYEAEQAGKRVA